jgi:beta-glucanase (GH16 family)
MRQRVGVAFVSSSTDCTGPVKIPILSPTVPPIVIGIRCRTNGFSQQFGYFEMRAKLPKGPGLWPAFWLIANKDEDTSAEIDILEHYGKFPDMYESVVHVWQKTPRGRNYQTLLRHQVPTGSLYEDFHLCGASVEADWTVFYLDRLEVGRTPTPPEHHHPMFCYSECKILHAE